MCQTTLHPEPLVLGPSLALNEGGRRVQRKQSPRLLPGGHWFLGLAESLCSMVVKGLCLPFVCLKSIFLSSLGCVPLLVRGTHGNRMERKTALRVCGSHCSGFLYPYPRWPGRGGKPAFPTYTCVSTALPQPEASSAESGCQA